MKMLVLYQDVQSGSKIATEAIVAAYRRLYPTDEVIVYKQQPHRFTGPFSFLRNLCWSVYDFWHVLNRTSTVDCIYSAMYTFALAQQLSRKRHIPSVFHVHGDQKFTAESTPSSQLRLRYKHTLGKIVIWLQSYAVKRSSLVCFVSERARSDFMSEYHLQPYASKTRIIPNGVDLTKFHPVSNTVKQALRRKYRHTAETTILYVGRIDEKKGIHHLIKSLAYLKSDNPCLLVIYPTYFDTYSDQYFQQLRTLVKKQTKGQVFFMKNPKNLPQFYQLSDCVVLPSRQEMRPLVMLESLASGTPFLCNDVGGVKETLGPLGPYLLLASTQPRHIADRVMKLVKLPLKQKTWLVKQEVIIAHRYTWQHSVRLLRLLGLQLTQPR